MFRVIARNIVSNWTGLVVQTVITFFMTPFVLNKLGGERYGIWVLVGSLTGYYGLLTMGLSAGTTQQITKAYTEDNSALFNRLTSTACFALGGCGGCVLLAALVAALLAPALFSVPDSIVLDMQVCILIAGAASSLQFALFPFSAVFVATQRYDLVNAINITMRVCSAMVTFIVLHQGGGIIALCAIIAISDSLGFVMRAGIARRLVPNLRISWRIINWNSMLALVRLSVWNTVGSAGQQLVATAGILVIGVLLTEVAIAPYAMAISLVDYFTRFLASAAVVFYPAAAKLFAEQDDVKIRTMYLSGTKMMMLFAVAGGVPAALWANDFYKLWIPEQLIEWKEYTAVDTLFLILLAASVLNAGMLIGEQLLLGAHRLRLLVTMTLFQGLLSVMFSSVMAPSLGLIGVALGTVIASMLLKTFVYPAVVNRIVGVTWWDYTNQVIVRPVVAAAILVPILYETHGLWIPIVTWGRFFLSALLAGALAMIVCVAVGLGSKERERFVVRPIVTLAKYLGIIRREEPIVTDVGS